jgi:Tfp pilus assembly protein PilZ
MRKPPRENRRRFRRRTVRVLVDYAAPDGVRCEYATTLGAGGLFIESDEPLPPGSIFKVRFRLPSSGRIHEVESRVVWSHVATAPGASAQAPGMGIVFTNASATAELARALDEGE